MQAWYLKGNHALPLARFGALVAASNILQYVTASFVGVSACLVGLTIGLEVPLVVLIVLASLLGGLIGGTAILLMLLRLGGNLIPWNSLRSVCARMDDGLRTLWNNKGLLSKVTLFSFGRVFTAIISFMMACQAVGVHVSTIAGSSISPLGQMGVLLPLTPGGLGVAEGTMAAAGHAWGLSADTVMLGTLVRRGVAIFLILTAGIAFSYSLLGALGLRQGTQKGEDDTRDCYAND